MLQAMVDHSDEKYKCQEMSDCSYTGTTIINKIPWTGEKDLEDSRSLERKSFEFIDEAN